MKLSLYKRNCGSGKTRILADFTQSLVSHLAKTIHYQEQVTSWDLEAICGKNLTVLGYLYGT